MMHVTYLILSYDLTYIHLSYTMPRYVAPQASCVQCTLGGIRVGDNRERCL